MKTNEQDRNLYTVTSSAFHIYTSSHSSILRCIYDNKFGACCILLKRRRSKYAPGQTLNGRLLYNLIFIRFPPPPTAAWHANPLGFGYALILLCKNLNLNFFCFRENKRLHLLGGWKSAPA